MNEPVWVWVAFNVFIVAALLLDLGLIGRKAHVIGFREAAIRSATWFALAMCFGIGLYIVEGSESALTFLTGYLIEQSLSVDNIFVMVVIFTYFGVAEAYQHRVLFWGIIGAIVMRGVFILMGAWLLHHFHFVIFVFGALLVVTGVRMAFKQETEFNGERNALVRLIRRFVPLSHSYDGQKFFTMQNGRRLATPLLLVLAVVEMTDLLFAVDSIPAIFAVTRDSFLVYTSNVFAILGLRSMYFMLSGVMNRFRFLRFGLAFILTFVGVKMLLSETFTINTMVSLLVVAGALILSVAFSLWIPEGDKGMRK